jgi:preprotein translocase SecE subunit
MKHVSWPTPKQTFVFTAVVIALSLITAAYLGFFDWLFTSLLQVFI